MERTFTLWQRTGWRTAELQVQLLGDRFKVAPKPVYVDAIALALQHLAVGDPAYLVEQSAVASEPELSLSRFGLSLS